MTIGLIRVTTMEFIQFNSVEIVKMILYKLPAIMSQLWQVRNVYIWYSHPFIEYYPAFRDISEYQSNDVGGNLKTYHWSCSQEKRSMISENVH